MNHRYRHCQSPLNPLSELGTLDTLNRVVFFFPLYLDDTVPGSLLFLLCAFSELLWAKICSREFIADTLKVARFMPLIEKRLF